MATASVRSPLMWYAGMREESIDISPAGLIEKR